MNVMSIMEDATTTATMILAATNAPVMTATCSTVMDIRVKVCKCMILWVVDGMFCYGMTMTSLAMSIALCVYHSSP